jgi:tetratricopeptide (TPR) repeat protein/CHAT domain-containing protein
MFKKLLDRGKRLLEYKRYLQLEWWYFIQKIAKLLFKGDANNLFTLIYEKRLELSRIIYPGDHKNLAASINKLALTYKYQGRLNEAEPLYAEALAIRRRLFIDFDHNDLAGSINNLATLYQHQGKFNEAEVLYDESLAMYRRLFSNCDHNDLAANLSNFATLYQLKGELSKAEVFYEEALAIRRRLFKKRNHHDLAKSLNNLAALYQTQGKSGKAEPIFLESIKMYRRLYGSIANVGFATGLNNLAAFYDSQGKLAKAQQVYKEALAMKLELFGDCDHHELAMTFNNLAEVYRAQGNVVEATPLSEKALGIYRRLFGDCDHPDLAMSINNLGLLYCTQGEYIKSEYLLEESLEMYLRLFPESNHNDLAASLNNWGFLQESQGELEKAEHFLIKALEIRRRLFTDRHQPHLAITITNLAELYRSQSRLSEAEPLYVEALAMYQNLYKDCDHLDLAAILANITFFYIDNKQQKNAFCMILKATEVEENALHQWFGYSTEEYRLGFVERNQSRLKLLVSLLCQYFPDDSEKVAQVAIKVARRKAFAAQAEVELNYQRYGDKYPDLARDFQELATTQGKLTHLNHTYYHHQESMDVEDRASHQQVKQTLTERIEQLERKLSANVPELRQLQQHVTLSAIFAALPEHSCAIEFYHFDVYNFAANEWQSPQYVAFILAPVGNVQMVKLGDARELDRLIDNYRDLSRDSLLPSFGARPTSASQQPKSKPEVDDLSIDLQLSQRLLTSILDTINGEIKHLIFIPDGALHTLPIGNLLVGSETRLFQKVGFLGGSLSDRFVCTYLSTLRELLTRTDRPNRPLSAPIAIGNPNYDYPDSAESSPALAGAGVSTMKSMMGQLGAVFTPIPESQILLDSLKLQLTPDAQFFSQDRATETVLRDAKSPKLLVILTHGYLLDGDRDKIQLIFKLLQCPEGEELDLIQTYRHLLDRDFLRLLNLVGDCLDKESLNGGGFCRSFGEFLQTELPELVDRTSGHSIDPMQNHGLALAGANSWLAGEKLPAEIGKGFLLARDVAYLDLFGTEIVFLIACSSGLGDVKTGEGVFGLRRAFAIAGVKQLITSLWDVPTRPTMLLTDKFFEAYHRGVVPAIALQTAQQYVRDISREELAATKLGEEILAEVDRLARCGVQIDDADYPLRHPYFWGAWICQGV